MECVIEQSLDTNSFKFLLFDSTEAWVQIVTFVVITRKGTVTTVDYMYVGMMSVLSIPVAHFWEQHGLNVPFAESTNSLPNNIQKVFSDFSGDQFPN